MAAHRRLHDGDELPPAGRLDFMARVMHTLGSAEPRFESSVVAVARVDGTLQLDALRERVRAELLQFWPLRCVIDGARAGRPRWRELGEAEITLLVGSRLVTAKQLASESQLDPYVGSLFGEPWDWALPLWRIELVSFGGEEARQTVLLVRLNHCIADGVAMLKMCLCLFDGERRTRSTRRAGAAPERPRLLMRRRTPPPRTLTRRSSACPGSRSACPPRRSRSRAACGSVRAVWRTAS